MTLVNSLKHFCPILIFSGIVGVANIYYYNFTYKSLGLGSKFLTDGNAGDILLSWGRSIIQIIYPFKYSIFYDIGSLENLIGIGFLTVFFFFVFKIKDKNISILIILFYSLSYLTVTHRPTSQFFFDAYLIFCILSFLIFFAVISEIKKSISLLLLPAALLLSIQTSYENKIKTNYNRFYRITYNREPACQIKNEFMRILLIENDIDTFIKVGDHAQDRNCMWVNKKNFLKAALVYKYYLFYSDSFTPEQKTRLINTKPHLDLDLLLLALIYFDTNMEVAQKYLTSYLLYLKNNAEPKKLAPLYKHSHNLLLNKCQKSDKLIECQDFVNFMTPLMN